MPSEEVVHDTQCRTVRVLFVVLRLFSFLHSSGCIKREDRKEEDEEGQEETDEEEAHVS